MNFLGALPMALAIPAIAAAAVPTSDGIAYQAAGAWVLPLPATVPPAAVDERPVQFAYLDNAVRINSDGTEDGYTAYRIRILKPEALPAGNVTLTWQPDTGTVTVHHLRLIRDGHQVDVLATTKFTVLQREAHLEQSTLTGEHTATLQVPGLQVGDELAFAYTVRRRQAALAGHVAGMIQFPVLGTPGDFRLHLVWPRGRPLRWRASADLPSPRQATDGADEILDFEMHNPDAAVPTEGAPLRANIRRLVEYSDFATWPDVSHLFAPLYARAATLRPGSPLRAEAATIAAQTPDPAKRVEAALQLVEDRVRYVFVGLDDGDYVPAAADDTWQRRFGDCKAKTALLIALLGQLGIVAEPALVNSHGGDGTDQRLPSVRTFDHIIVRAMVGDHVEWLDATRLGDRALDTLPRPFRWALPVAVAGGDLVAIPPRDPGWPLLTGVVEIDATAGIDAEARMSSQTIIRGDEAFALRSRLSAMSASDADRALKSYWRKEIDWVTPDKVEWSYDERRMAISLRLAGRGNPPWTGDAKEGHGLILPGAGFYPPDVMRRPADQDQAAPWAIDYPRFKCWATTVRLPKPVPPLAWSLYAEPMDRQLGGTVYWRAAGMHADVVRTVMSRQSIEAEVSAAEADAVNKAIPKFNNATSNVAEVRRADVLHTSATLPFDDGVDWLNAPTPCSRQAAAPPPGGSQRPRPVR